VEFFNNVWCFMKLRSRTRHFWRVFVFTTNHMILSTVNPMKCPQKANQNRDQNTRSDHGFGWIFEGISSDLRTGILCGWWWTQKHFRNEEYVASASWNIKNYWKKSTWVSLQKVGSQIQRIPELSTKKKVLFVFRFSDEFSVLVVVRIFQYV